MKQRNFGIEIEMSSKIHNINDLIKYIIPKQQYEYSATSNDKSNGKFWHLKKDYSTETELATPILKLSDKPKMNLLKKILKTLQLSDIKITKHDGIHVHIDCKDMDWNKLLISWIYLEESIKHLFPKYRTRNTYRDVSYSEPYLNKKNKKIIAEYFEKLKQKSNNHHSAINFQWFEERGTVEFRWHEGSIDYDDLVNWVKFIHYFIEYSMKVDLTKALCSKIKNFDCCELIEILNIKDTKVVQWVKDRYDKFYK